MAGWKRALNHLYLTAQRSANNVFKANLHWIGDLAT